MRNITAATNYREGEDGEPKHVVTPFLTFSDEMVALGFSIANDWPTIRGNVRNAVEMYPGVVCLDEDVDEGGNSVGVCLGCDDSDALSLCLIHMSLLGFNTGMIGEP
jgi:hypothetical protein